MRFASAFRLDPPPGTEARANTEGDERMSTPADRTTRAAPRAGGSSRPAGPSRPERGIGAARIQCPRPAFRPGRDDALATMPVPQPWKWNRPPGRRVWPSGFAGECREVRDIRLTRIRQVRAHPVLQSLFHAECFGAVCCVIAGHAAGVTARDEIGRLFPAGLGLTGAQRGAAVARSWILWKNKRRPRPQWQAWKMPPSAGRERIAWSAGCWAG